MAEKEERGKRGENSGPLLLFATAVFCSACGGVWWLMSTDDCLCYLLDFPSVAGKSVFCFFNPPQIYGWKGPILWLKGVLIVNCFHFLFLIKLWVIQLRVSVLYIIIGLQLCITVFLKTCNLVVFFYFCEAIENNKNYWIPWVTR